MRCPNCGQALQPNDKFCANCGAPAPLETMPGPPANPYGDPYRPPQLSPPPSFDYQAMQRAAASQRSFTSHAVIAFVLYWFGWVPGLIANLVFWNEARGVERVTGKSPDGYGCLVALLIVFGIFPFVGICFWVAVIAASGP